MGRIEQVGGHDELESYVVETWDGRRVERKMKERWHWRHRRESVWAKGSRSEGFKELEK